MAVPKKLGRYELRRVLGKGAMGVVYEGYDPTLGRRVAVKTILKSVAHDEETERNYAERFVREAKAVARLNHPNIIQVFDFGVENDVAYLVMEFIQGRELRSFFDAKETFDVGEVVRIMGELLDALHFAHEANVIHRDVKPANVMLDAQRRVKLADFGVARVQDSDRSAAGTMVGTPAFMSPEQIQGQKVDRRTDIFSAGVILYQLLTGEQPFMGEGAWTVAKKIVEENPPQPSSVVKSVFPVFDGIVSKALAKKPAQRYANAREFAATLRSALGAEPIAVAPQVPAQKAKPEAQASDTELEFWRAIQNSTDAAEFEFYLGQFPEGTYAPLARHKIAKLKQPAAMDKDATVAMSTLRREIAPAGLPAPSANARLIAVPVAIGAAVIAGAIGAYLYAGRAPAPAAETAPAKSATTPAPAVDAEKIRREAEERVRKEFAEKAAVERAAMEKAVMEKIAAERIAAEKITQAKTAAERAAAEKAAASASAERVAAQKAAAEKAAANRAAAEKADTLRAAAEKAAMEKDAAERAATEKAAAEKIGVEKTATKKVEVLSDDAKLERFIQRVGRDRVMKQEPINLLQGQVVYVNDGSCGSGRIRELTGGPTRGGGTFRPESASASRCIPLE